MAQFLMAKFLSQALEWKVRFPSAQFYEGLRYEPFVYEKARLIFPEYSKLYPDNKQFTEKFVKDLRNKDEQLLKIVNPQVITPEHEEANIRFETEARLEQQQVAQIAPEQTSPPFSLSTAVTGARLTPIPTITGLPAQEKGESAETMEAAQEETHPGTAQPSPQTQTRPGFTPPKMPLAFRSAGKDFGSAAQRFTGTNLGRIGRGLGEIAKGVGRGIAGPMLNGAYKVGGGGLDAIGRLSSPGLRGASRSFASSGSKKLIWGLVGAFLILVIGTGFIGGTTRTTPGEGAPISTGNLLDYTIPFRDSSVIVADPDEVKKQVLARWPNAKLENWDIIVSESIKNGWNPAFVLSLWIEETGAQGEPSYSDPLGCAPGQPTTDINLSLSCLFNNFQSYTNEQFEQFMLRYSEGFSGTTFATNPSFPSQIKDWYSKLVPSGVGALTLISTQTAEALGCPTVGTITNPYGYNIPGQQPSDIDYYGCGGLPGCHSGIDIAYGRGTSVSATFDGVVTTASSDDVKGKYVTISNSQTGYSATFEHLDSQIVSAGESVKRGQVIGTMGATGAAEGVHLHYRLERNSKVINPFRYLGSSGLIATISLTQSDDIGANNYQGKAESLNWGQCNQVP